MSGLEALDFIRKRFNQEPVLESKPEFKRPLSESRWAKIEREGITYPAIIRPFGDKMTIEFPDLPIPPVLGNYLSDVIANARFELHNYLLDSRRADKLPPSPRNGSDIIENLADYEAFCWIHASTKQED